MILALSHPTSGVREIRCVWSPLGLCLLVSISAAAQPFVEISAEIEITSYRSGQSNAEATAKTRTISVGCITGTNSWRIESNWSMNGVNKWLFDGTNVHESLQVTRPSPEENQDRAKGAGGIA